MAATGRVTALDMALATLSWSFVPAIQLLAGMLLIASAPRRAVSVPRAIELFFACHAPWSLWLLFATAWIVLAPMPFPGLGVFALSALVPAVWTATIVSAFCRVALLDGAPRARLRTAAHQASTWTILLGYVFWSGGVWPRLLHALGR
jgi:hypothetical protein